MASEIRVNKIENRSGLGTVTFADTGVDLAGIVTATTFSGSGASLTNLPAGNLSGTLPAISAANLTNVPAANITGTLPAISAANLTNIPAANVTGTLPALTAANLTNIPAANLVGVCTAGLTKTGGFGKVVQYKYDQYNALLETTSSSYQDWSSYFSVAITPTSSTNLLVARFDFQGSVYNNTGHDANATVALTDDGASSYLFENDVRIYDYGGSGSFINLPLSIEHVKVAGSTSARTYSIRVRLVTGAKFVVNNYSGSSGTNNSVLSVMEIEP